MTAAIIQARMGATRLPGKVLLPLPINGGDTVLGQVCRRVSAAEGIARVIVATTENSADDPIAAWVERHGYHLYRGSENDVLARYYHAAKAAGARTVIRITADCPCLDPEVVTAMLDKYRGSGADYLSNTIKRTFPHGLDAEIFSFPALEKAFYGAEELFQREHVTPYLYMSGLFKCANYTNLAYKPGDENIRVTLDTPQDYIVILALYDLLRENFLYGDICGAFNKYKWLKNINESIIQKKIYSSAKDELRDAVSLLEKQDMKRAARLLREAAGTARD